MALRHAFTLGICAYRASQQASQRGAIGPQGWRRDSGRIKGATEIDLKDSSSEDSPRSALWWSGAIDWFTKLGIAWRKVVATLKRSEFDIDTLSLHKRPVLSQRRQGRYMSFRRVRRLKLV